MREFELAPKHAVLPDRYTPAAQLRQSRETPAWLRSDQNGPLELTGSSGISWRATPSVERFGPTVYVPQLTYSTSGLAVSVEQAVAKVEAALRDVGGLGPDRSLRELAKLAAGSDLDPLGKIRRHVTISLSSDSAPEKLPRALKGYIASNRIPLIGLHITGRRDAAVDPRIERAMLASNVELNLKAEDQLAIVNAQGSMILREKALRGDQLKSEYRNRPERLKMLSVVATAMQQTVLRATSLREIERPPWSRSRNVIGRWTQYPESVLHSSVSSLVMWKELSREYGLEHAFREFDAFDV